MEILSRNNGIKMKMTLTHTGFLSIAHSSKLNQVQRTYDPKAKVNHKIKFPSWAIDTVLKIAAFFFMERMGEGKGLVHQKVLLFICILFGMIYRFRKEHMSIIMFKSLGEGIKIAELMVVPW